MQSQQPLTTEQSILRYALALVPILFFGVTRVWAIGRGADDVYVLWSLLDGTLSLVALVLLRWRRRWPLVIALVTGAMGVFSSMSVGPAFVAYTSLCTHRRWAQIVPAAMVLWAAHVAPAFVVDDARWSVQQVAVISMTFSVVVLTVLGFYRAGEQVLASIEDERARDRARAEQDRLERARRDERERIAREMHDVLAHRLSLLSLHASALAHRTDLTPDEVRAAADVIQENAHQSLDELRAALGVLRQTPSDEAPQPSWPQLGALFDEVRAAGQEVTVTDATGGAELPQRIGRHAYRVVQEALTNARKHAPDSAVAVELAGSPGDGLRIRVANALDPYAGVPVGTGAGLVGLAERAHLLGGDLTHGIEDGDFVIEATLPWPAA